MESNTSETTARPHVTDLVSGMRGFQPIDYCIFIAMLAMSTGIGIYFGYKDKQKSRTNTRRRDSVELDYLVGGRKLKIFPVAMSLTASWISGISIMGMSSEVYVYGIQFAFFLISVVVGSAVVHFIFIPVFHDLKITSAFEYLEARFDKKMRLLSATIFCFTMVIWLPLVFYATALAFNQMTGISIHLITPITCSICIFYTCLGGMKAVVWTDVIQTVIMYGTIASIVIKGTMEIGFGAIWERNYASGRIEFPELTLDPNVRTSIIAVLLGGLFFWTPSISANQMFMQRYVSLPTVSAARKSLWIFVFAVVSLLGMCYYSGLLAYAKYHDCDPMTTKLARSKDQILPVLVADLFRNVPGIPGLFVSGIFSAALSSLSTALNAFAAIILEDFCKQFMSVRPSVRMTNFIMRSSVIICGFICVGLVFVVERLGSILQLSITIGGSTAGPSFAIYIMGLLMPRINTKSAFIGGGGGLIVMIYIVVRAQIDQMTGRTVYATKPVAADNCPYEFDAIPIFNSTIMPSDIPSRELHHMSYLFYALFGMIVTIIISTIASFVVKHDPSEIRPELLAPFIRKWYETDKIKAVRNDEYELANKRVEFVHRFENSNKNDN